MRSPVVLMVVSVDRDAEKNLQAERFRATAPNPLPCTGFTQAWHSCRECAGRHTACGSVWLRVAVYAAVVASLTARTSRSFPGPR